MKSIIFVSGNTRKLGEARSSCDLLNIRVDQESLPINEIQSHDPSLIAVQKAADAYDQLHKPLVINDAYWTIPSLNGFPGGYIKDIVEWFNADDFLALLGDKKDRRVVITECIVYQDDSLVKLFTKEFHGVIGTEARGKGNSIEQIAIFNGMTLAEHHDLGQYSEKPEDQVWYQFAQWFKDKEVSRGD